MKDKHPIDKLFKEGLGHPDIPFDEKHWEILQKKLEASKPRSVAKLVWIGSTIAASLVIAALVLFNYKDRPSSEGTQQLTTQQLPPLMTEDKQADQPIIEADAGTSGVTDEHTSSSAPQHLAHAQGQLPGGDEHLDTSVKDHVSRVSGAKLSAASSMGKPFGGQSAEIYPKSLYTPIAVDASNSSVEQPIRPKTGNRFTLGMAIAPDLSGTTPVNGRLSGNVGLLAAYHLNDRFRVSSGLWYARKVYQADFAAYRTNWGWPGSRTDFPETVAGDCQVLDIPINLDYTLRRTNNASWFLSGGVSSYIMLKEVYDFTYPNNEHHYPQQYEIRNENRHIFGVVNVGVGYQRKLNPSLGITVQPFMKVPVSNIGHGNIKLYSTGVALSVDVDLSRRTKH